MYRNSYFIISRIKIKKGGIEVEMNILLLGSMGSGKTEISKILRKKGYRLYSVAEWLKLTLDVHYKLDKLSKNDIVSIQGREFTKRELYQWFGTELIRNFDTDFHVDKLIFTIELNKSIYRHSKGGYNFCVDDVRFQNEIDKLREYCTKEDEKCIVIKLKCDEGIRRERLLTRDGNIDESRFNHISETGIDAMTYDVILDTSKDIKIIKKDLMIILKGVEMK